MITMVKIPVPDVYYGHWHGDALQGTECITLALEMQSGLPYMVIPLDPTSDAYEEFKLRGMILEEEMVSEEEYAKNQLEQKKLIAALNAEPN